MIFTSKQPESNACSFIILSWYAFLQLLLLMLLLFFLSKSVLFMNPVISNLSTKFLIFMLLSTMVLVNLL